MQSHSGFTLIELLVVIAIIGILSSVTLATLSVARAKGADAAIKIDLDGVRKNAVVYYDDNGSFGDDVVGVGDCSLGLFAVNISISDAIAHAVSMNGGTAALCFADDGDLDVGTMASSWAVSVQMKANPAQSWCVDSNEFVGLGTAQNAGNVAACVALAP